MAKTRRNYSGTSVSTTIVAGISAVSTASFDVHDATNWPYGTEPFTIVVDPETASEEKLLVTRTNISDVGINIVERAFDGTSAVEHASGATTFPVFTALDADEANELTSVWEAKGDIVSHGASAFERVIVGADDTVLIADSSAASGLSWGQVGSDQISAGAVTETELDSSVVQQLVPVGTIAATIRSSADAGWALMGTTVTNAENNYPALWAVAPAGWQSGSDLVLPDMSDRYLSGKSSTDTLGAEVGSNDVTLATANLPSHTHSGPSHSHTINHGHGHNIQADQSAHTHSVDPSSTSVTINANDLDMVYNTGSYTNTNYIATDTSITDPSGNHPYYVPSAFGMAVASTTSHTHTGTVDIASFTSGPTDPAIVMSGGVTDHSGSSGSAGTGATGATGDGDSFSIQSAHLVVNFQLKIL